MNVLLLLAPVILSTVIWPINRWVMQNNGRSEVYGFWISLTGCIAAGIVSLLMGQSFASPDIWWIGLGVGIAFSIGFCLIINYCLKIGPTGPTVTTNNMGLVGPVVVSFLFPVMKPFSWMAGVGFLLVIVSLIGFGMSSTSSKNQKSITPRWVILVFIGWLLAGVSMTGQYVGSVLLPNQPLALVSVFFLFSTLILLPFMVYHRKNWFRKNEMIGGMAGGVILTGTISITMIALLRITAQVVFPVTVLGPAIAVLFLSAIIYKEKLNRLTWLACVVGVVGLALLSLSR